MTFSIITADQRRSTPRGVKALIVGPSGVGKTSLLKTIDPTTTLFVDLEAGDLSVQDVPVDTLRPKTWQECRDLAAFLGGPNPSLPNDAPYSQAHYDAVCERMGGAEVLDKYETYFIDSLTVAGRICFQWCRQQPESITAGGKDNLLKAYGLLGQEMISFLTQIQHARAKNVVFVGILEQVVDDYNRPIWRLQIEGGKVGRELPGIVDQVITMSLVVFDEEKGPVRAFVTKPENNWSYPAKDRSGRLELFEKPHLGELIAKITKGN